MLFSTGTRGRASTSPGSGWPSSAPARPVCRPSRWSPSRPPTCTCSSGRPPTRCPRPRAPTSRVSSRASGPGTTRSGRRSGRRTWGPPGPARSRCWSTWRASRPCGRRRARSSRAPSRNAASSARSTGATSSWTPRPAGWRRRCTARRSRASCGTRGPRRRWCRRTRSAASADHRRGLLRDVQPRQRHAGRPPRRPGPGDHLLRHPHRAGLLRRRRHPVRDRFRRAHRRAVAYRRPRPGRCAAARALEGRGPRLLPRPAGGRVPEPVHDPGAGQPVGRLELPRSHGTPCRMDRRLRRAPA